MAKTEKKKAWTIKKGKKFYSRAGGYSLNINNALLFTKRNAEDFREFDEIVVPVMVDIVEIKKSERR